jgi:hypothetical protein
MLTRTQFLQKKLFTRLLWVCLALYLLLLYYPLITEAGISVDDWGDIAHNLDCSSYWDCYLTWFPLFSNRPLAPLPITTLSFIFGTWYMGYLLVNSLLYILALGICAKVIRQIAGLQSALIMIILGAIPIIAMPVITSPINQSTATLSFLFWAISLWCLYQFTQSKKKSTWILCYVLLLLAFLTYEVILPLLILTALLPWVIDSNQFKPWTAEYIFKFLLPMGIVLLLIVLWQKGIAPQYMEVDSRLKFIPAHAIAKLHTFFDVFYRQIPILFIKMPNRLGVGAILTACFGAGVLLLAMNSPTSSLNDFRRNRFFIAALTCFLASSSIFILSDESAIAGGYQARGLSSTWFSFVILLTATFLPNLFLRRIWVTLLTCFTLLSILSFCIQRNQTIHTWQMQLHILDDVNSLISHYSLPKNATVMGDVPHYLANNYNDEIVFSQPWDFGAALAISNKNQIKPGPVIDSSRGELRQLRIENGAVMAQNFGGSSLNQFWVYKFNPELGLGTLSQISNQTQFDQLLNSLKQ